MAWNHEYIPQTICLWAMNTSYSASRRVYSYFHVVVWWSNWKNTLPTTYSTAPILVPAKDIPYMPRQLPAPWPAARCILLTPWAALVSVLQLLAPTHRSGTGWGGTKNHPPHPEPCGCLPSRTQQSSILRSPVFHWASLKLLLEGWRSTTSSSLLLVPLPCLQMVHVTLAQGPHWPWSG